MTEIQKGYPKLSTTYWDDIKKKDENKNQFDINTDFALKDLSKISVFKVE